MSQPDEHDHPHPAVAGPHGEGSEDAHDAHADRADADGAPGSHHGHGHDPVEPLGPVDGRAWAAAIAGSALAIIVVVALYLTIST